MKTPRYAKCRRPFDADNHLALAMKINTAKVPTIPSRYSQELDTAIKWMLNKKVSTVISTVLPSEGENENTRFAYIS